MSEVTVVMSAYNAMPYLPEAVESIFAQTLQDCVFVIINDGSTDGTEGYLNGLVDQRVKVVHQSNRGQGAARNVGLALCESEYVAIMDADDISFPLRLETQLHFLRHHKEVGMVGAQAVYFVTGGRAGLRAPLPCDHKTIVNDLLRGRNAVVNATLMLRTSIIRKIGGFRVAGCGEDLDLWLRMGEASRIANLDDVLLSVRIHLESVNVRHLAEIRARYAQAIQCAKKRADGQPEITFDEFLVKQRRRLFCQRVAGEMDLYSLAQYRRALIEILSSHCFRGYARLAWAAICSPWRSAQRISRQIRN